MRKKKYSIKACRKKAAEKNGKCLSNEYVSVKEKLLWECEYGSTWWASLNSVNQGRWCPESCCNKRKYKLEEVQSLAIKKGGKCLSGAYQNNKQLLLWECGKGHVWEASFNNVKAGSWCNECRKKEFSEVKKEALRNGFKALSGTYENRETAILWECECGHVFEASYKKIQQGAHCGKTECRKGRGSLEDCHLLAEEKGGICISKKYLTRHKKMIWECSSCNKKLSASYNEVKNGKWCGKKDCSDKTIKLKKLKEAAAKKGGRLISERVINQEQELWWECGQCKQSFAKSWKSVRRGIWCNKLSCKDPEYSIKNCKKMAAKMKGRCLSKEYNHQNELLWECEKGKQFYLSPKKVKKGIFCREECCIDESKSKGKFNEKVNILLKRIKEKGGKIITSEVKRNKKILIECKRGHIWEESQNKIIKEKWCPQCQDSKNEDLVRRVFEEVTGEEFKKERPAWLINQNTGKRLELDGYSKKLKIAFEYQGRQHYEYLEYFHKERKNFHEQKQRDLRKKRICKELGIKLIVIKYFKENLTEEEKVKCLEKSISHFT